MVVRCVKQIIVKTLWWILRHLIDEGRFNSDQEIDWGLKYLRDRVMPDGFVCSSRPYSAFYLKYGIRVPEAYNKAFKSYWQGSNGDRFMSLDLYYCYIVPMLNRFDFINALTDKGFYSTLFHDVRMPKTIVKNRNGIYYDNDDRVLSEHDAIVRCSKLDRQCQYIIKPTVDTACGMGVALFDAQDIREVEKMFNKYKKDFIIQIKLKQHKVLNSLNESSLNTLRLYTYRDSRRRIVFLDEGSMVRIGSKGSVKDNVSAGGGFCPLDAEGNVSDRFMSERTFEIRSLAKEKGLSNVRIPSFGEAKGLVLKLHERFPYFDLIGWDIAIDEDGYPVFIELNTIPFIEGPQMAHGPMFGGQLDDVLERLKGVDCTPRISSRCWFSNGSRRISDVITY